MKNYRLNNCSIKGSLSLSRRQKYCSFITHRLPVIKESINLYASISIGISGWLIFLIIQQNLIDFLKANLLD